jgi:hypothetical protein
MLLFYPLHPKPLCSGKEFYYEAALFLFFLFIESYPLPAEEARSVQHM